MQVYYKLGTYLRKQDAHKIADISRKQKLSVWEAALQYGDLDGYVRGSISAIQTHIPVSYTHLLLAFIGRDHGNGK